MKKIFKSNQIAITSLAIMIAVAGYLNFTKSEAPSAVSYDAAEESLDTIDTMDISDGDALISEKVDDEIPTEETETIGDAVLTQAQVGERLGLSQRTYAYYESGQRMVPPEVLCALGDLYGVSVDYLLGRTDRREMNR